MTRKDYEAIAEILRGPIGYYAGDPDRQMLFKCLAGSLADYMEADNPRFDRERFLAACRPS